ncbi:Lcl domain-containing protein [Vibrio paucivorans]
MKYQLSIIAAALLLAGCNGSGSDSSADTSAPTYSVSGTITALSAQGDEKVCADLNGDFACSSDEPSTTANNGEYTITSTNKSILQSPIVAELASGSATASRNVSSYSSVSDSLLVAPAQNQETGNDINVITTLVASQVAGGASISSAIEAVKTQLQAIGLPATDDLMSEGGDNDYRTLEKNLLTIIGAMDKANTDLSLVTIASNLSEYQATLLSDALTDEMVSLMVSDINLVSKVAPLNDTGVTQYFSDSGDSNDSPADYPGQDAEFGFDNTDSGFKFVKLDSQGEALADDATEWSCVKDERSGLVWETKVDDADSPQYKDRLFVYQVSGKFEPYSEDIDALNCKSGDGICSTEEYVEYVNTQQVCGVTSWRLPTFSEFYNLIDFGETEKDEDDRVYGLNRTYFPRQTVVSDFAEGEVWTSTEFFTEYEEYKTDGAMYVEVIQTRGTTRGTTYAVEIYSDQVEADWGTSYQLPIRLVANMESN